MTATLPKELATLLFNPHADVTEWKSYGPIDVRVQYVPGGDFWLWQANGRTGRADDAGMVVPAIRGAMMCPPPSCPPSCRKALHGASRCRCACQGKHHGTTKLIVTQP